MYNRSTFFARMNTTGYIEGMNGFFDDFVTSTTNLREFGKNKHALKKIVKRENKKDFEIEQKYCIVGESQFLLKDATKVYTRTIFKKFKE